MSAKSATETLTRDVFLCHASEDKERVVEPLHQELMREGISCWYDNAEIFWGDSISRKVNEGLKISRYVIVVLSATFLKKPYPQSELGAALDHELSTGETKVLPLLYGTQSEREEILRELPILRGKLYIPWTGDPQEVVNALRQRLHPGATKLPHSKSNGISPLHSGGSYPQTDITRSVEKRPKGSVADVWKKYRGAWAMAGILAALILCVVLINGRSSKTPKGPEYDLEHYLPETTLIKGGHFLMGSNPDEIKRFHDLCPECEESFFEDEMPQHEVDVDSFYISKNEITNEQYKMFLMNNPDRENIGDLGPPNYPAAQVSWFDAAAYCKWLSEVTGKKYRLPTEAEWEKAAKGSAGRRFPWGDESPDTNYANFKQNPNVMFTKAVGSSPMGITPDYGLVDMAGNVSEWCSDWYSPGYDDSKEAKNPTGRAGGERRVARGGSWRDPVFYLRCAARLSYPPQTRRDDLGFRVVREP